MNSSAYKERLFELREKLESRSRSMMGYPLNQKFDYSEVFPFFKFSLNNVGDPYEPSSVGVNTLDLEREVLEFFAELFRVGEHNWWGYVTHGGSEGNMYGLYLARERFPKGIVYYCESAHYSIPKSIKLLNISSVRIKQQANGEMDYEDLRRAVEVNRHLPAIVLLNSGTTMTEAKDDIFKVKHTLEDLRVDHYLHVDGALSGMILPFTESRDSMSDFANGADSVSVSGHKFLGSPMPCGVIIAKKENRDRVAQAIPYISSKDATIAGSRNGMTPLILWYAIQTIGKEGMAEQVKLCLAKAKYAEERLNGIGIAAWRNQDAITVVLPKPSSEICLKWQLATEGEIAHIITMPDITYDRIDAFVADLKKERTTKLLKAS